MMTASQVSVESNQYLKLCKNSKIFFTRMDQQLFQTDHERTILPIVFRFPVSVLHLTQTNCRISMLIHVCSQNNAKAIARDVKFEIKLLYPVGLLNYCRYKVSLILLYRLSNL